MSKRNQRRNLFLFFTFVRRLPFKTSSIRSLHLLSFSLSLSISLSALPFLSAVLRSIRHRTAAEADNRTEQTDKNPIRYSEQPKASFSLIPNPFPSLSAAAFFLHTLKLSLSLSLYIYIVVALFRRISFCFGDIQQPLGGSF